MKARSQPSIPVVGFRYWQNTMIAQLQVALSSSRIALLFASNTLWTSALIGVSILTVSGFSQSRAQPFEGTPQTNAK